MSISSFDIDNELIDQVDRLIQLNKASTECIIPPDIPPKWLSREGRRQFRRQQREQGFHSRSATIASMIELAIPFRKEIFKDILESGPKKLEPAPNKQEPLPAPKQTKTVLSKTL